jgi:hypothetical protein
VTDAGRKLPKTDKGWQAYLSNARPPEKREWLPLGGGLVVCREPSGTQTFQGRPRRKGERIPGGFASEASQQFQWLTPGANSSK